jgi:UDP-N-acetylmuramate: L-alanyl-gamma-D-glutamyl-meso-diaminopimelate ligase
MRIHLIGVAGTGMSALATLLAEAGHRVSGSDTAFDPPMGPYLQGLGIECSKGWRAQNLANDLDLVIVGNVCRPDNPEAQEAMRRGLRTMSMPAALAEHVLSERKPLVVAGTHGKTTTSALLAYLLHQVGTDAGFFIGGIPLDFDRGARLGMPGAPFVIEGDEYDSAFFEKVPKFWSYRPAGAVLTSIEHDHADIFPEAESYVDAFRRFVRLIPEEGWLFAWAGDPTVREVASTARCQVRFYALDGDDCGSIEPMWLGMVAPGGAIDLFGGGSLCGRARLPLLGRHNARNAVAALAIASEATGAPLDRLIASLPGFRGTKRRQELVGITNGVEVYDDFAHHPTAVKETLAGFRERATGRLIAVFEPRSATASRRLHEALYPDAFASADVCILAPVGRSGIAPAEKLRTEVIVEAIHRGGGRGKACRDVAEVVSVTADEAKPGDTIVVMSNGTFDDAADRILLALLGRRA